VVTETLKKRERTFAWTDPAAKAQEAAAESGLAFLRTLPRAPVAECLGFALVAAEEGKVVFELVPEEFHANPMGLVHGGVACMLIDSAAGAAVHSTLPLGSRYVSLETKVNFVRPITPETGRLRCEGTLLSRGSRVALAEGRLLDASGKLLAHGTSTCLITAKD
jgi:uncharacterized protein (TIGR00369 family)